MRAGRRSLRRGYYLTPIFLVTRPFVCHLFSQQWAAHVPASHADRGKRTPIAVMLTARDRKCVATQCPVQFISGLNSQSPFAVAAAMHPRCVALQPHFFPLSQTMSPSTTQLMRVPLPQIDVTTGKVGDMSGTPSTWLATDATLHPMIPTPTIAAQKPMANTGGCPNVFEPFLVRRQSIRRVTNWQTRM